MNHKTFVTDFVTLMLAISHGNMLDVTSLLLMMYMHIDLKNVS